ncbi:trp operon leader peptide [Streptomyces sp. MBT70]|nr:trp operon leader peptide [Streptomyces sp. MBT70]
MTNEAKIVARCGRVPRMFAPSIQNWWWTASLAAH